MAVEYFFDSAEVGDEVCFVDEFLRAQMDTVLNVENSNNPQKKFVHLEKSNLVIFNGNKEILYHKNQVYKLLNVLAEINRTGKDDWRRLLQLMMKENGNKYVTPPVPNNGKSHI